MVGEFKFQALSAATPLSQEISDKSPAFEFAAGKSYFTAIELPEGLILNRLLIKTWLKGIISTQVQIFCPGATFFDKSLNVVSTIPAPTVYWQEPTWTARGFNFTIIEIPPLAKYVAIHTSASNIGERVRMATTSPGYGFFTGKSYIYVPGQAGSLGPPCGQQGSIDIEVR